MPHPIRRKMILVAAALCLTAQGVFAMPDCRCAERDTLPPCHQSSAPERGACCAGEDAPALPGSCSAAMQSSCCGVSVASATETAAVQVTDHAGDELAIGSAPAEAAIALVAPSSSGEESRPPAPPGVPVWLLNATLRN